MASLLTSDAANAESGQNPIGQVSAPDKGMAHDLLWTTLASVALILGNAALTYMLARRGAIDVFGPYNLAKRMGAGLVPVLTLGLTVGLVYNVAAAKSQLEKRLHISTGLLVVIVILLAASMPVFLFPRQLSQVVLGTDDVRLLAAIWVYTLALVSVEMVFSIYRARFEQSRANVNRLLAMTVVPVTVVAFSPSGWDGASLLLLTSVPILAWNGWIILAEALAGLRLMGGRARGSLRVLLAYSLPRIPAVGAMGVMMAVGSYLATRAGEPLAASYLLAGMAIAVVLNAALSAFSIVLLPRVAVMRAAGKSEDIRMVTERLLYVVVSLSCIAVPVVIVVAPELALVWMGSEFAPAAATIRAVMLSVPAVLTYSMMKSIVDGAIDRPVNTHAAVGGALLCVVLSFAVDVRDSMALAAAYSAGCWITALWVLLALRSSFRIRPSVRSVAVPAALGALVCGIMWFLTLIVPTTSFGPVLVVMVAALLALAGLVLAGLFSPPALGLVRAVPILGKGR